MAPEHERARLLSLVVERAIEVLNAPISKIEVTADKVLCSAGSRRLTMSYGYANALDASGGEMPGSGHWWVMVDGESVREKADVAWALGRVAGKWLRSRDTSPKERKGG